MLIIKPIFFLLTTVTGALHCNHKNDEITMAKLDDTAAGREDQVQPQPQQVDNDNAQAMLALCQEFDDLCLQGKYEQASEMLTDDFVFVNPISSSLNKAQWLERFPALHADKPDFGDFEVNDETISDQSKAKHHQVFRKGTKKKMMITFHLVEMWTLQGQKIQRIEAARA